MRSLSVYFLTTKRGGGVHESVRRAIFAAMESIHPDWTLQTVDAGDQIAALDPYKRIFGMDGDEVYGWMLQKGWHWLDHPMRCLNNIFFYFNYERGVALFAEYWRQTQPDIVISVIPWYNLGLWDSLQRVKPGTPVIVVITDLADNPPHFWFEPETGCHWVCGSDKLVEQALSLGISSEKIHRVSGLAVHPRFYEPSPLNRRLARQQLNLDPDLPLGIILFGALGSPVMVEIVQRLDELHQQLQLLCICGHNEKLVHRLRSLSTRIQKQILGFTTDIPLYMKLSDFLIGKPGGISTSESLVTGLPLIVSCNAQTLRQERYNATWIAEQQVGKAISSFQEIVPVVRTLLEIDERAALQNRIAQHQNYAVFEIVDLVKKIAEQKLNS
ncbi:MAG TPA: hypothetical protein DCP31_28900 [Cyanobacteria bacterium UBA8543]|nr:hypothetical protein [Cyanobacteria bacterium UBA8543]